MDVCPNCGSHNLYGDFCLDCGFKLPHSQAGGAEQVAPADPPRSSGGVQAKPLQSPSAQPEPILEQAAAAPTQAQQPSQPTSTVPNTTRSEVQDRAIAEPSSSAPGNDGRRDVLASEPQPSSAPPSSQASFGTSSATSAAGKKKSLTSKIMTGIGLILLAYLACVALRRFGVLSARAAIMTFVGSLIAFCFIGHPEGLVVAVVAIGALYLDNRFVGSVFGTDFYGILGIIFSFMS